MPLCPVALRDQLRPQQTCPKGEVPARMREGLGGVVPIARWLEAELFSLGRGS